MTGRATLPAFVSQVCSMVVSFDRPRLDLQTTFDGEALLLVSSVNAHKVETVRRLALMAGLNVTDPGILITPFLVVSVKLDGWREVVQ